VELARKYPEVRGVENEKSGGFDTPLPVVLEAFPRRRVCIVMADASDDPADVLKYSGSSRRATNAFLALDSCGEPRRGLSVVKLALNRLANWFIKLLFRLDLNDTTNAFKCIDARSSPV